MDGVKWVKIATNIFENRKIKQIETLPNGDSMIVIWVKLLCLAGNINDSGKVYLTEEIPYTVEMLSVELNRPLETIQSALNIFQKFGMIEITDDLICISSWGKYQNVEGMEKIREQTRKRVSSYRERKKTVEESNVTGNDMCNVTSNVTETQCNAIDKEEDIEEDKDIKENIKRKCKNDCETVVSYFNSTCGSLPHVSKISDVRERAINARLKENGMETVKSVIDKVKESDFLNGLSDKGWKASFDWIMKPSNFQKILEGVYDNRSGTHNRHEVFRGHTQQEYFKDSFGNVPDFDLLENEMQNLKLNDTG